MCKPKAINSIVISLINAQTFDSTQSFGQVNRGKSTLVFATKRSRQINAINGDEQWLMS